MKNTFFNLVEQTFYFPQEGFDLQGDYLKFHGVSIKYLIEKYETPFRLIYLPRIAEQIKRARNLFKRAMKKYNYSGSYHFCYCTKCCHFHHVVSAAMKHNVNLETSSSFDFVEQYQNIVVLSSLFSICWGFQFPLVFTTSSHHSCD